MRPDPFQLSPAGKLLASIHSGFLRELLAFSAMVIAVSGFAAMLFGVKG